MFRSKRQFLQTLGFAHSLALPGLHIESDDGGGDDDDNGGGGGGAKAFTQDEVNALLAKERKKLEAKFKGFDELKAKAAKVDELAAKMTELEEAAALKDKDAGEQAKILAERARAQADKQLKEMEAQVAALTAERDGAKATLTTHIKRTHASEALAKAGVLASAGKHALRAFLEEASVELDEQGNVTGIEYAGVPQKDLAAAATAFLNDNDIFKLAKPGGSGTRQPNGVPSDKDLDGMSGTEMAALAWKQRPSASPERTKGSQSSE